MKELKGLFKFSGSKNWYFRFFDTEGKRRTVTLGTDDLAVAIQKKREILGGQLVATPPVIRARATGVYKVVDDYLKEAQSRHKKPMRPDTAKRQRYILTQFLAAQGIEFIGQITCREIEDWLDGLKKEGRSADTLHTYARALNTFVAYLVKIGLVNPGILKDFDIPDRGAVGRKNWLKNSAVAKVIEAVKPRTLKHPTEDKIAKANEEADSLKFVLFCGFHAGLRKNEIANAKVGWFDLEAGLLHVQNDPKTGFMLKDRENRSIPLSSPFKEFLKTFLVDKVVGAYVLHPEKTLGKWRYRYDFSGAVNSHFRRCKVTSSLHDMRRSFASNLVSSGESIYIVAKWLGDGVEVVERSYGHLAPSAGNINRLTAKVA